ncbi:diguanylate cyclase [Vibrio fluvialis]|uniref:diguanylate cyclase n=1 Tax=Vibrio TaxID=662 RepID=UPI001F318BDB|nr:MULTISPECIES: diguanylate cyclase [Vibrio]MBY8147394.1 diguanylate cyclase [Vibrio fluvialis]MCE7622693.1 diguanylate cyclase [Vibrio fluvialis]MCE7637105.1 diguanylate cyclase [Vibrio fluvialis]MCG6412451.1 diguanylate cyclase [Vibrio fluvialis]USP04480.1 diguanylate cyclase [Vibrio sp. LQ2]
MTEPRFTVLVVDDQATNIQLIYQLLKNEYDVLMATTGQQAIAVCREHKPDLILMDVLMPDINGWETCKILKRDPDIATIPVIFVTALTDQDDENACWDAGAVDFLQKPINANTLKHRVRAHLTLKHQSDLLRSLAYVDGLTGISSRRHFDQYMEAQMGHAFRKQESLGVLLIDIDFFKQYNDRYGHIAGDDCLRQVAQSLKQSCLRSADMVARYGGEEFVLVLPDTNERGLERIAQRIKQQLEQEAIAHIGSPTSLLTVSAGGAVYLPGELPDGAEAMLILADTMLYKAKAEGRNRSCIEVLHAEVL